MRARKRIYQTSGVREYWIVDPLAKTIELYILADQGYQLHAECDANGAVESPLLGLRVPAGEVFAADF